MYLLKHLYSFLRINPKRSRPRKLVENLKYIDGKDLQGAHLDSQDMSGKDLSEANLQGASLDGANLRRANLQGQLLTLLV
jgi:uncharacterized protein YjbI with pentapeptide repeats